MMQAAVCVQCGRSRLVYIHLYIYILRKNHTLTPSLTYIFIIIIISQNTVQDNEGSLVQTSSGQCD